MKKFVNGLDTLVHAIEAYVSKVRGGKKVGYQRVFK